MSLLHHLILYLRYCYSSKFDLVYLYELFFFFFFLTELFSLNSADKKSLYYLSPYASIAIFGVLYKKQSIFQLLV